MRTRLIIGTLAVFGIFLISQLSPNQLAESDVNSVNNQLTQLADLDFTSAATRLWDENNKPAAVSLLKLAIELDIQPTKNREKLLDFKTIILENASTTPTLMNEALTHAVSGSSKPVTGTFWAELINYGELVTIEPISEFAHLNYLGNWSALSHNANDYFNALKALHKSDSLSTDLEKMIEKAITPLAALNDKSSKVTVITSVKAVVNQLTPIKVLVDNCSSPYQIQLFLRTAKSNDDLRAISKIIANGNVTKLEQLFTVLGKRQKAIQDTTLYVQTYGQAGLNNIHNAIRKGAEGIKHVLENPTAIVNLVPAENTSNNSALAGLKEKLVELKKRHGSFYEILKNLIIVALLFITIVSWLPSKLFQVANNDNIKNYVTQHYLFLVVTVCTVIYVILLANYFLAEPVTAATPSLLNSATTAGTATTPATTPAVAAPAPKAATAVLSPISWAVMLIFLILHAIVGSNTKGKIDTLAESDKKPGIKLNLLKNIEHDLDLSVYIGLAGTVTSFIIMQFDPSGSRILAYSSTLAGIIISCVLKTLYYQPLLNELVDQENSDKRGEEHE